MIKLRSRDGIESFETIRDVYNELSRSAASEYFEAVERWIENDLMQDPLIVMNDNEPETWWYEEDTKMKAV